MYGFVYIVRQIGVAGRNQAHLPFFSGCLQPRLRGSQSLRLDIEGIHTPAAAHALRQKQRVVAVAGGSVHRNAAFRCGLGEQAVGERKDVVEHRIKRDSLMVCREIRCSGTGLEYNARHLHTLF